MSIRAEVLLWATRVMNRDADQPAHTLLEVKPDATLDEVQTAFHDIARTAHPDLHRTHLGAEELELVTSAYSRVAAAYQDMRTQKMQTTKIKALEPTDLPPPTNMPRTSTGSMPPAVGRASTASMRPLARPPEATPPNNPRVTTGSMKALPRPGSPTASQSTQAIAPITDGAPMKASEEMNSKALVCYRKAELCLRRGDLKGAVLQLKLAIASDPQSPFLRTALAEVESEVNKA